MWNSAQGTCTETGMDMKNTEEIYTDFARVYDELMDNTPYEEWGNRLDELIRKYGVSAPERDAEKSAGFRKESGGGFGMWNRYAGRAFIRKRL